ncbi:MAG TPA: acyl-CoA dehydrogenase family protein [Solirubrobacterales bacterium]|nr:acyl-CoA dehydrogenase family protein [Solirubrobacterales bacterium]
MDLELTDEQKLLSDSVETLLERGGDAADAWDKIVEFGGLMVGPEGLGAVELCLIANRLGAHLASVPYLGSAAARYALLGTEDLPAGLAGLDEEPTAITPAFVEPGGGWTFAGVRTTLADGALSGEKAAVEHADAADALLVVADAGGGPALALVRRDADGLRLSAQESIDPGTPLARATLDGVAAPAEATLGGDAARAAFERLLSIGGLLAAAEANGAAEVLLAQAVEYAGTRRQFGRTIGSNQALRHILAEMYVRRTSSWSSILYSAAALDDGAADAATAAGVSKAYASRATREVAHGAMQVFGGIAFTEEHDAHRFLRRINLRGSQFGDAEHHERLLGRALAASRAGTATVA